MCTVQHWLITKDQCLYLPSISFPLMHAPSLVKLSLMFFDHPELLKIIRTTKHCSTLELNSITVMPFIVWLLDQ